MAGVFLSAGAMIKAGFTYDEIVELGRDLRNALTAGWGTKGSARSQQSIP